MLTHVHLAGTVSLLTFLQHLKYSRAVIFKIQEKQIQFKQGSPMNDDDDIIQQPYHINQDQVEEQVDVDGDDDESEEREC